MSVKDGLALFLVRLLSEGRLLAHIVPLGWEHICFNGDYVWPAEPLRDQFRPLRHPRSPFLDGA